MLHIATLTVRLQEQFLKIFNRKLYSSVIQVAIQVYKDVYIFQQPQKFRIGCLQWRRIWILEIQLTGKHDENPSIINILCY